MKKTYEGSCHCKRVRFEADLDLEAGTGRCNCSYCGKLRAWGALAKPDDLRILAGEDELASYQFNTMSGHHHFCRHCGVHVFGRAQVEQLGGAVVSIKVACLDGITDAELAALPVTYQNGRDDAWWVPPAEIRHM